MDFGQEDDLGKDVDVIHRHFFSCSSVTLVADADNGEENACVRAGVWEPLFSSQCYYKPKTTLRNEIFKYEKKIPKRYQILPLD